MNYLAMGIQQGWQSGTEAVREKRRAKREDELATADAALRRELLDKQLTARAQESTAKEALMRERMDRDATRRTFERDERATDPRELLSRRQAERQLSALDNPSPDDVLAADVKRMQLEAQKRDLTGGNPDVGLAKDVARLKLEKEKAALTAPTPEPVASITQAFGPDGKSRARFTMPAADFQRTAGAQAYKSPYAEDLADVGRTIAEHQAQVDGGDKRTGFLNLTSRQDLVDQAQRKQRRLQALELQDQLSKGIIDQEEADRRANLILGRK